MIILKYQKFKITQMKKLLKIILFAFAVQIFTACGTKIAPQDYDKYAFVLSGVPDGAYPCIPGSMVSCEVIRFFDRNAQMPATKMVVNPGMHEFGLGHSVTGYRFKTEPGYRYILMNNSILVSLRSDETQQTIDVLRHLNGEYVSSTFVELENIQKNAIRKNIEKKRIQHELPLIRKIGAEICQYENSKLSLHGFVELISDSKVKINIDGGPYSVWDFPENWQLCGKN